MTSLISNPSGAGGQTAFPSYNQVTGQYIASAAIVAPMVVAIGTTGQVAAAGTGATTQLATIGIATTSGAIGDIVTVVHIGVVKSVPATAAITAGGLVQRSTTTAGSVIAAVASGAATSQGILGIAVSTAASNLVDVFVCPSFGFPT